MSEAIKVWDIATRTFHWSLVITFFVAYISGDEGDLLHAYSSYLIIGLLCFRIIWGLIGPRYARFNNFIYGIKPTLIYLKSLLTEHPKYYLGHNPIGGWMIILLLISLTLTSWTGLELYAKEGQGPLAKINTHLIAVAAANGRNDKHDERDDDHDRDNERGNEEWLEELHEALAEFTLILVFLHICGVLVSGVLHRENLIKAMWTGYKTPPDDYRES